MVMEVLLVKGVLDVGVERVGRMKVAARIMLSHDREQAGQVFMFVCGNMEGEKAGVQDGGQESNIASPCRLHGYQSILAAW